MTLPMQQSVGYGSYSFTLVYYHLLKVGAVLNSLTTHTLTYTKHIPLLTLTYLGNHGRIF